VRRVAGLGFPQGPYSLAYQRCYEIWMCIEAGQLDSAAKLVEELAVEAKRHGFDFWILVAATQRATITALSTLSAYDIKPERLEPHIAAMAVTVESWRAAEAKLFVTFYDGVLARLLIAAGRLEEARKHLDIALELATETDVNFYRAELLRLRAHTAGDAATRDADLRAAIDTAREQSASIFELRAAIDAFELQGECSKQALIEAITRFPVDSGWPELARARTLSG
jgi:tetratricopeptide (TPR) repeat protein